jgi:hypothetical protein
LALALGVSLGRGQVAVAMLSGADHADTQPRSLFAVLGKNREMDQVRVIMVARAIGLHR